MKYVYLMTAITAVFGVAFGLSLNWSMGIDYAPVDASVAPLAITWLFGVLAFASLGGILGAVLDYLEKD